MCMRVAVLGARGLIGGAVVRRAILAGHHVRAIVRPGGGVAGFPAGTEVIAADLRSRESVVDAVRRMEVVVHAASVPYPEWPRVVPLLAENALAAAEAAGATLVFPGNVYVYGRPRSRFVTEDHPQEPHTVKGRVRLAVERRLLQAHQDGRVDIVLPRYPDVYGPGGMHDDVRPVFEGALTGRPCRWPLDADAPHEFILNDDAAEAMLKLLGTPAEFQHRFGRVVVENEFVERVGIERPSARPPGERAFEDGADVVMHPAGAIDVRVSREDDVHASVLMGLEQPPFNGQPNPSFHRVRFLRMIFRDEPRSRPAVDVHVARKNQGRARGCRGRERVVCEKLDHPRPFRVRDRRRMDDHLHAADRMDNGFPRAKVRGDPLGPRGESGRPTARTDDGADVVAREDG